MPDETIQVGDVWRGKHADNCNMYLQIVEVGGDSLRVRHGSGRHTKQTLATLRDRYVPHDGPMPEVDGRTGPRQPTGPVSVTVEFTSAETEGLYELVQRRADAVRDVGAEVTAASLIRSLVRREHATVIGPKTTPTGQIVMTTDNGETN